MQNYLIKHFPNSKKQILKTNIKNLKVCIEFDETFNIR